MARRVRTSVAFVVAFTAAVTTVTAQMQTQDGQPTATVVPYSAARFEPVDPARPERAQIAVLRGDPATGPSTMLMRLSRGAGVLHVHSADYELVVIEGRMKHWGEGETEAEAPTLGPGSYWRQPGMRPHADSCLGDTCLLHITWSGKRDAFLPPGAPQPSAALPPAGPSPSPMEAALIGDWTCLRHCPDEDIAFAVEDGARRYRSWLHHRPATIDAEWTLSGSDLTVTRDGAPTYEWRVVAAGATQLVLQDRNDPAAPRTVMRRIVAESSKDEGGRAEEVPEVIAALHARLRPLLQRHYPQAKVSLRGPRLGFEHDTRVFLIHTALKTGEWQEARETKGPDRWGILGTVELVRGRYAGAAVLPQTFDERYFRTLALARPSPDGGSHLYVHLSHPDTADEKFLREFVEAIENAWE